MTGLIEGNEGNWDQIILDGGPILVDFWAPWCGWCRKLAPSFERLASDYEGRIKFVKVNVDEESNLASHYGVQGLPTLKLVCDGEVVDEIIGYLPEPVLRRRIDEGLAKSTICATP